MSITLKINDKAFDVCGTWSCTKEYRNIGNRTKDGKFWFFTFSKPLLFIEYNDITDYEVNGVIEPSRLSYETEDEILIVEDASKLAVNTEDLEYDDNSYLGVWSASESDYIPTY